MNSIKTHHPSRSLQASLLLILVWAIFHGLTACQPVAETTPTSTPRQPAMTESPITSDKSLPRPAATLTETPVMTETPSRAASPTSTATPQVSPTLVSGVTRISPKDGMVQVYVPQGFFKMGSLPEDNGADHDEFPLHEVALDAFWIDQTEVTNQMYAQFLNDMGNQQEDRAYWLDAGDENVQIYLEDGSWHSKNGFEGQPVVEVTWFGANAYCQWAGRFLPTEAQWEKAARGIDRRIYPPGEKLNCLIAHTIECQRLLAEPVGAKPDGASPYGALDMAGNVWEWTADWYSPDYYAMSPVENPTGPGEGEYKVLRGGSFNQNRIHARAANRRNNAPGNSQDDYGFRCANPAD